MRFDRLVAQRAAVRAGVGLRDRESEPGAFARRRRAAREALEEAADELLRDARARVLDRHPELAVGMRSGDEERLGAVAPGIRQQVRDDPVEGLRVDDGLEVLRRGE